MTEESFPASHFVPVHNGAGAAEAHEKPRLYVIGIIPLKYKKPSCSCQLSGSVFLVIEFDMKCSIFAFVLNLVICLPQTRPSTNASQLTPGSQPQPTNTSSPTWGINTMKVMRDFETNPGQIKFKHSRPMFRSWKNMNGPYFPASFCNTDEDDAVNSMNSLSTLSDSTIQFQRRVEYESWNINSRKLRNLGFSDWEWCRDYEMCLEAIRLHDEMPPLAFCVSQHSLSALLNAYMSRPNATSLEQSGRKHWPNNALWQHLPFYPRSLLELFMMGSAEEWLSENVQ